MEIKLTNQMKCAIGEQLVSAHLIAHGWPTVNVNSSINNFKGIDLYCQNGIDGLYSTEVAQIQVKTTFQGKNSGISIGMNCKQAANRDFLENNIKGPWVFVHVKELESLSVDFYILTRKQIIDLVYRLHHWYLYEWERRPCTESLEKSVACIRVEHILGKHDKSRFSDTCFDNPMAMIGLLTLNNWNNIGVKD